MEVKVKVKVRVKVEVKVRVDGKVRVKGEQGRMGQAECGKKDGMARLDDLTLTFTLRGAPRSD
jgi:hypothetical protein